MGLENIGGWELIALVLLGLFIFGPDKLPKAISDGLGMLRQLRNMARNATSDLSRELGTDIQLEDLHPRTFVRKHLLSEEDEAALRRPLEQAYSELRQTTSALDPRVGEAPEATAAQAAVQAKANGGRGHTYDADAT